MLRKGEPVPYEVRAALSHCPLQEQHPQLADILIAPSE